MYLSRKRRYKNYMQSKEWRALRKRVLERDEYKCAVCNSKNNLEVHHLFYEDDIYNGKLYQMITLCKKHHKQLHKARKL